MCVWLLAPIVIVVILAFSGDGYLRFPPTSFSLQWFDRFFGNLQWQRALLSSLIIGAIACIVSTTIGFFSAYAFLRTDFRGKKLRRRFRRRPEPLCATDADYPPDTRPRSAELPAVAEAAVRVRRHFCAGGSGRSIGPSAPWTAFENKNCTGTRPPPVLLRIS
jgi:hypothetical protein